MKKIKVGIIGCGTIGSEIAKACTGRLGKSLELIAICDVDKAKAANLSKTFGGGIIISEMEELIKGVDLVIEAASARVSADVLARSVNNGRDCLIMSVGGLLGAEGLLEDAASKGIKVYIPSGAICGLDGLKSASGGRIDSVTLTTRKPPRGLEGAPYLKAKGINAADIDKETVVFEGSADEAIRGFPQNVNVAAVLSLAGLGAGRTRVRIVSSPDYKMNTHEVEVKGEFGRLIARTENVPSGTNPKTSALAIFSAIATLEGIAKSVRIGT